MVLDIVIVPDERLRKVSADIDVIDKDIKNLIKNMKDTLKKSKGVGLAAPQVGVNKNLILVKPQKEVFVFINPKIIHRSKETDFDTEGCLSLPDIFYSVERSIDVQVEFRDEKFGLYKISAKDFFARILQHEIDHLNGVLITDIGTLVEEE